MKDRASINSNARDGARNLWNSLACGELEGDKASIEYFDRVTEDRFKAQDWTRTYFEYAKFKGKRVLEIGVGQGTDLIEFATGGAECYGVDISTNHLQLTEQNFRCRHFEVALSEADATRLPFPDNYFDCVYSFGVLHHIPEIEQVIAEVNRVLKPGGTLRIALYHKWSAYYLINMLLLRGVLSGRIFKLGYAGLLSTIEKGADGITLKPYVSLWTKPRVRHLLRRFSIQDVSIHQFLYRHILPPQLIPGALDRKAPFASRFGWWVAAKATKGS